MAHSTENVLSRWRYASPSSPGHHPNWPSSSLASELGSRLRCAAPRCCTRNRCIRASTRDPPRHNASPPARGRFHGIELFDAVQSLPREGQLAPILLQRFPQNSVTVLCGHPFPLRKSFPSLSPSLNLLPGCQAGLVRRAEGDNLVTGAASAGRRAMNNSQLNTSNQAIRRILNEIKKLRSEPSDDFEAHPAEDNVFDWHFVLRGPAETPFAGGLYHGRIILPAQYPYKPPEFMFLCPTGRFEVGKKICLSISQHHPELWQPGWDIRTALTAIQSFMPTAGNGAIAALDYSDEERRRIADKSREASTVSLRSHGMLDHFEEFLQRPAPSDSPAARGPPAPAQGLVAAATDAASPPPAAPRFQSVRTSWVEEGSKPASLDDAVAADAAAALPAESAPTFGGVPVSGPQNPSPASRSHRGPPAHAAGAPVAGTQPLPVPPLMDVGAGSAAAAGDMTPEVRICCVLFDSVGS